MTIRDQCFWPRMQKDVLDYVVRCMECQRVKVEHRHLEANINKFPWKTRHHDSIMMAMDKLTNVDYFIKMSHKETIIEKLYMEEIAILHGVPREIVSDIDPKFQRGLFKGFGTNLKFSMVYHL